MGPILLVNILLVRLSGNRNSTRLYTFTANAMLDSLAEIHIVSVIHSKYGNIEELNGLR
jgi:hypothetical protein